RKDATGGGKEPIDGSLGGVFRHSFHAVLESPAVMTIEIAFPLRKEVGNDGMESAGKEAGFDIRSRPTVQRVHDLTNCTMTLATGIHVILIRSFLQLRTAWERRFRQLLWLFRLWGRRRRLGPWLHQQFMQLHVKTKRWRSLCGLLGLLRLGHLCFFLLIQFAVKRLVPAPPWVRGRAASAPSHSSSHLHGARR